MAKEDYLMKLSMMQQEAERMQEQVGIVNSQIAEFEVLKLSLENIDKSKEKEMLANLGKGVFIKTKVEEKELFVNVGEGVVVRKNADEACRIIDRQISQLKELKTSMLQEIEKINSQLQEVLEEARQSES